MTILVCGAYGFLGFSLSKRLLEDGHAVIGIDKLRDAVSPKGPRIEALAKYPKFKFFDVNMADAGDFEGVFQREKFEHAVFLAGQYSQGHSEKHVQACIQGNVIALVNFFQAAVRKKIKRVLYASSTFVQDGVRPKTMYGCTKEFAEMAANVYSEQCGLETIGLRFGSVYGPHVRPDVGIAWATRYLYKNEPVAIDRGGFTYKVAFVYVDDAVECMMRFLTLPEVPKRAQVFTIVAEDETRDMCQVFDLLELNSGRKGYRIGVREPEQQAFVPQDKCDAVRAAIGYAPSTKMEDGIREYVKWYANK